MLSNKYILATMLCLLTFSRPMQANRAAYLLGGMTEFGNQVVKTQTIPLVLAAAGQAIPGAALFQTINLADSVEQMASYWTGHQPVIAPYNPSRLVLGLASWLDVTPSLIQVIKPLLADESVSWDEAFNQGRQDYVWIATLFNGLFSLAHLASMGFQILSEPAIAPKHALVPVRGPTPVYPSDVTTEQTTALASLDQLGDSKLFDQSPIAARVFAMLFRPRDNQDPFRDGELWGRIRTFDLYGLKGYMERYPTIIPPNALSEALWYAQGRDIKDMVEFLLGMGALEPQYSPAVTAVTPAYRIPPQDVGALEWGPVSKTTLTLLQAKAYCASQPGSGWRLPTIWELFAFYQSKIRSDDVLWSSSQNDPNFNTVWTINFWNGYVGGYGKLFDFLCKVRCVRSL